MTGIPLTDDDRVWLGRWRVGRQSGMDWLASQPPADQVRAILVKVMDRRGPEAVFARVMADHLGADQYRLYAENWPRKAAALAASCRERGEHPRAGRLHAALIALMFCANCGRPLNDPVSIERGIGPDCWPRIDPAWRDAISGRRNWRPAVMDDLLARISEAAELLAWRVGVWRDLGYANPEPGQHAIPPLGERSSECLEGARGAIEVIDEITRDLAELRVQLAGEILADQDARAARPDDACELAADRAAAATAEPGGM